MRKLIIFYAFVLAAVSTRAQTPPSQLPSLLDGTVTELPVLKATDDPDAFIRKNIFVKATVSKTNAFIGEPLLVTYKLYTALNSQARVSKQPAFNGCSVMELNTENEPNETIIGGKPFHVFTIRKVQVIPLQEGLLQLGQAFVDNVVQLPVDNIYNMQNFSVTLNNSPVNVDIRGLPAKGRPKDFTGIVGRFSIDASIDSNRIPVGENATLRVTIKGSGNITAVNIPFIHWPQETEHFDGSDTQHIDQENFPVTGYKVFEVPFIGDKQINAVIDPITFSYFDPLSEQYKTVSTKSLPVVFTKAAFRDEEMKGIVTEDVSNKKYLWIVVAIGVMVISLLFFAKLRKPQQPEVNKPTTVKQSISSVNENMSGPQADDIREIFSALNDLGTISTTQQFLSSAKSFLTQTLQRKFSCSSVSEHELVAMIEKQNSYVDVIPNCNYIFETCNRNLYSPVTEDNIQEKIYFELTAVVKRLYGLGMN